MTAVHRWRPNVRFVFGLHSVDVIMFLISRPLTIRYQISDKQGLKLKKKFTGWTLTKTAPNNVTAVKASVEQYPWRSARKHAVALHLPDRYSVRKILHQELNMYLYKIVITQELNEKNWDTCRTSSCRHHLRNIPSHMFCFLRARHIITIRVRSTRY